MCMNHTKMGSLLICCSLKGSSEWFSAVLCKSYKSSFRWMWVGAKQGNMMLDSVCCEYNKTLVLPSIQLIFFSHLLRPTPDLQSHDIVSKWQDCLCFHVVVTNTIVHIFFRTKLTCQSWEKWLFFSVPISGNRKCIKLFPSIKNIFWEFPFSGYSWRLYCQWC